MYFLTEVSEKDLMNFTLSDSVTLPEVDTVYAEPEKQAEEEKPETTETDEKDKVEDEIQMPEEDKKSIWNVSFDCTGCCWSCGRWLLLESLQTET